MSNDFVNGQLMHKNDIIANIVNNELFIINYHMIPSYFKFGGNILSWLENRCIDLDRHNSKLLIDLLKLKRNDIKDIVLSVNALTLTDNYWIRLDSSPSLTYENIQYSNDLLFEVALNGATHIDYDFSNYKSPNLTLGGSFEKSWKLINGEWYIVKCGTPLNNSIELIASKLASYFKFNAVEYFKYDDNLVCCKSFTNNLEYDFEPMYDFVGDEDDFDVSIKVIAAIDESYIKEFLDILFLDAMLLNPDRHTNNYGFLRNSSNGDFIGLAPIFDNNLALFSTKFNVTDLNNGNLGQIKNFYIPTLKEYKYQCPELNYDDLNYIVTTSYKDFMPGNYTAKFTTDFIWNKYIFLKENLR